MIPSEPYHAEAFSVPLLIPNDHRCYTEPHEMQLLVHLASLSQKEARIVEFGCNRGITSLQFAFNYPTRLVVGVDYTGPDETMASEQRNERPPDIGRYALHCRNFYAVNSKTSKLDWKPHYNTSFVFIDADHRYEGVKADTEHVLGLIHEPLVPRPFVIVWHDYENRTDWEGVFRYLNELNDSGRVSITHVAGSSVAYTVIP